MSAESEEVAVQVLHVYGEMGSALRSVYHHGHVVLVGNTNHLLHGVHRAEHVAHLGNAHYLGAPGKQTGEFIEVYLTLVVDGNHTQGNAFPGCLQLPGHDVGVVLHGGDNHLVALGHKLVAER